MAPQRTLFRGATVVSMDPRTGVLPRADVLVEGGSIAAVAPDLGDVDAEVVDVGGHLLAPGMIDTHRHTWQTQMRGLCADWTLADYVHAMRRTISPAYTAADVAIGNRLGAAEALAAGVTTLLDYSHCNSTPDHADAALDGLVASGVRAVFGYGFFESSPAAPQYFADHAARLADFRRISERLPAGAGRITLGAALTEIGQCTPAETRAEIETARELGALVVAHTGCVWSAPSGVLQLDAAGLLGPDQVHVHANTLTEDEWAALARAGAKVSISPETELNMGMGRPVFAACRRHGIRPTLSCDIVSLTSGDLLGQLRSGLGFARWELAEPVNLAGADPRVVGIPALEALEWVTTNAADAIGREADLGSITPGKRADLVVVGGPGITQHPRHDPAGSLVFQTSAHDVRHVLVDGQFVKRDGALVGLDLAALTAAAEESAAGVLARAEAASGPLADRLGRGFTAIAAQRRRTFESA
jgi:cytosine/adenosine deaminase-related metal-dependent hydrolase